MTTPVDYYVWYRVTADPAGARAAVDALLQDVMRDAGVTGRLLVRRDDPHTWMEVYERVDDTVHFESVLEAAMARHDIARRVDGGTRHTEPFVAPT